MLFEGSLPLNDAERAAVNKLTAKTDESVSFTRRDRGETGPLLVHVGPVTHEISETGRRRKIA